MSQVVHIRRYTPGEEGLLFEVFHSAIHMVASLDYTAEQIDAWAPRNLDPARWERKIRAIDPFVAELGGELVGYADIQPSGYLDHFYVSGRHPRRGIGSLLMNKLLEEATSLGMNRNTTSLWG